MNGKYFYFTYPVTKVYISFYSCEARLKRFCREFRIKSEQDFLENLDGET